MELRELAESILFGITLEEKLVRPEILTDQLPQNDMLIPAFPGRSSELSPGVKQRLPFPKDHELEKERSRAAILHFFANHELLAMELMALALLRFPDAPPSFRMGIAETIREEQDHLILYRDRMNQLGMELGEISVNDFFWNSLKGMRSPMDYVTGMSMTFEQANLDYSLHYMTLLEKIGDRETFELLDKVYQDEIGHVKYGITWFDRWRAQGQDQWTAYRMAMFGRQPLTVARAKGIGFDRGGRIKAGFSESFVDQMEVFENPKGKCPNLHWYNADCELENGHGQPGYTPSKAIKMLMGEFETLPMFYAQRGDAVLCQRAPSFSYQKYIKERIGQSVEFVPWEVDFKNFDSWTKFRSFSSFKPWGWTPNAKKIESHIQKKAFRFDGSADFEKSLKNFYRKSLCPDMRRKLREDKNLTAFMGPEIVDGVVLSFLLVAGALITLQSAGAQIGWGFHLQNPLL